MMTRTKSLCSPGWLLCGVLIATLLLVGFAGMGVAYADDGEEPGISDASPTIQRPVADYTRLEEAFARLNEWYAIQDANVGKAYNAIARIEEVLARGEELGIDTSPIQALMPDLYAAVDRAAAAHTSASDILSSHAGFDSNGGVVDPQQALETCRAAHESLAAGRDSLLQARESVHEIIRIAQEWRDSSIPLAGVEG